MKLLIFDLDGTLVDSQRDIVWSVNQAFRRLGYVEQALERIGGEIGRGSEYLFRRLLGPEVSREEILALVGEFREIYAKHLLDHTTVYSGVFDALDHYGKIPKVIVTNKNQAFADRLIEETGLRPHFEAVFGSEAFLTQKPDPGPILEVCRLWNTAPRETAMIGDSEFDVIAGKQAGARTVGALYGFGKIETNPDHRIETAEQLIGLFERRAERTS